MSSVATISKIDFLQSSYSLLDKLFARPLSMEKPTSPTPIIRLQAENAEDVARAPEKPNDLVLPKHETVFVDFVKGTQERANEFISLIKKYENTIKTPDFNLKDISRSLSKNLEEKLRPCNAVILIYDEQVPIQWFIHRLLQYSRLNALRFTPLRIIVYIGDTDRTKISSSIKSVLRDGHLFSKSDLPNSIN